MSSAPQISASAAFAPGCADSVSAARTLPPTWNQHRCSVVWGNTSRIAFQNPSAPDSQHRGGHPTAFAVAKQVGPRLRGFAEAVGDSNELLLPVGADPDHHQQAHRVLLEADLEVGPVNPHIHVVAALQRPLGERGRVILPPGGQPGDRGRGQARSRAEELFQGGHEVPRRQPVQIEQRQHLGGNNQNRDTLARDVSD